VKHILLKVYKIYCAIFPNDVIIYDSDTEQLLLEASKAFFQCMYVT